MPSVFSLHPTSSWFILFSAVQVSIGGLQEAELLLLFGLTWKRHIDFTLLLFCVSLFDSRTATLIVSYVSLPLRKLLEYLVVVQQWVCARTCFLCYWQHPTVYSSFTYWIKGLLQHIGWIHTNQWADGIDVFLTKHSLTKSPHSVLLAVLHINCTTIHQQKWPFRVFPCGCILVLVELQTVTVIKTCIWPA